MADDQGDAGSGLPAAQASPTATHTSGAIVPHGGEGPPATLSQIIDEQHGTVVRQIAASSDTYIGVKELEYLKLRGDVFGGKRETLPGIALDRAFAWINSYGTPELWAAPDAKSYSDYWTIFCETYYRQHWKGVASGKDWNIDHMFPKGAGKELGLAYVRLTAVDAGGNQRMGHLERQMKDRFVEINALSQDTGSSRRQKAIYNITEFTLAKITGFPEPITLPKDRSELTDTGVITRLIDHVTRHTNIPESDVIRDLRVALTQQTATMMQTTLSERDAKRARMKPFRP